MSKKRVSVQVSSKDDGVFGITESRKKQRTEAKGKKQKLRTGPESELRDKDYENLSDFDDGITSDADIEYDDELDLDNVSSDDTDDQDNNAESGSEDENDDDNDENLPKLKKRKKNIDDGSESFANAVSAILGSKLKAYDRKDPILARSKQTIKKAESEKLEAKARQELLSEKKKVYDKDRVKDLLPKNNENARSILEHERKLKKIAQRGVIRLFNVIMSTQNKTNSEASKTKVLGQDQKDKLITEISKENFFDLVKQAGN